MKVVYQLKGLAYDRPLVLTIGNFDGIHLGHQAVLQESKKIAEMQSLPFGVVTFVNHPLAILHPEKKLLLLTSLDIKKRLFEKLDVDLLILLEFTKEFSQQSAQFFLEKIHSELPFKTLVLGYDAVLGRNREGSRQIVEETLVKLGSNVIYLDPYKLENEIVSSSKIRDSIIKGDLEKAAKFLGRDFVINGPVIHGASKGKLLGYPTINLDVSNLCLPPFGVYAVEVVIDGVKKLGAANLGVAPTLRIDSKIILEIHLFETEETFYGKEVDVIFRKFIRPEITFKTVDQLKEQILKDIILIKSLN